MAIQIVMDHTGDTRHHFDAEDIRAVAAAERRFKRLMFAGFTAAVRTASGDTTAPNARSLAAVSDRPARTARRSALIPSESVAPGSAPASRRASTRAKDAVAAASGSSSLAARASVGTLAAGVAHEINNPLATVTANIELLIEELRTLGGGSPSARLRDLDLGGRFAVQLVEPTV